MSAICELVRETAKGVRVVDAPEGLSAIHRTDCAAALWQRAMVPGVQAWLDALEPDQLPKARVILRPADVRAALELICATSGTPDGPQRARLVDDVAALAVLFTDQLRTPYLRLRFDVVTTNACRRFHVDAVTARLVCTYRGTGTQYGNAIDAAEPEQVFTVPTGAPILMRGKLWPERPTSGLLHRSPPIEGSGETRLVLVLDPIEAPGEEI